MGLWDWKCCQLMEEHFILPVSLRVWNRHGDTRFLPDSDDLTSLKHLFFDLPIRGVRAFRLYSNAQTEPECYFIHRVTLSKRSRLNKFISLLIKDTVGSARWKRSLCVHVCACVCLTILLLSWYLAIDLWPEHLSCLTAECRLDTGPIETASKWLSISSIVCVCVCVFVGCAGWSWA